MLYCCADTLACHHAAISRLMAQGGWDNSRQTSSKASPHAINLTGLEQVSAGLIEKLHKGAIDKMLIPSGLVRLLEGSNVSTCRKSSSWSSRILTEAAR